MRGFVGLSPHSISQPEAPYHNSRVRQRKGDFRSESLGAQIIPEEANLNNDSPAKENYTETERTLEPYFGQGLTFQVLGLGEQFCFRV